MSLVVFPSRCVPVSCPTSTRLVSHFKSCQGTRMPDRSLAFRSDEGLAAILDEPTVWKLVGRHRVVLGTAETLREAVQMAGDTVRRGGWVVAVVREPDSDIVVF